MGTSVEQRSEPEQAHVNHQNSHLLPTPSTGEQWCSAPLLRLPGEILEYILSHLACQSLVSLSRVCRRLRGHAENDLLWAQLLRSQIPPYDFPQSPFPRPSYRDLYISHHPYWFLPRYKIWFSNAPFTGKIILVKFDPRRGCIEGYRLLADKSDSSNILFWPREPSVLIHSFSPTVHLWLDDPVLRLEHEPTAFHSKQGWWEGEIQMKDSGTFFLAQNIPEERQHPGMELWPPQAIPGMPRIRSASQDQFRGKGHKPQKHEDISQTTFRLRKWTRLSSNRGFFAERPFFGCRVGELVSTWSTIDPVLYTPTKEKPYQGIYVGDYAGHGCEFLLVTQTEKAPDPPDPRGTSSANYYQRLSLAAINAVAEMRLPRAPLDGSVDDDGFHGAIEAIKLTGDAHVQRGEHTFIADDIGPRGLMRIADEPPFRGARVVKSRGHVANRGFADDEFIPSQLIMMSHSQLAQYWVLFDHISFYRRVDIDELLSQDRNREETEHSSAEVS